jgi:hypothetical protein
MLKLSLLLAQVDLQDLEALKNAKRNSPKIFGADVTLVLAIGLVLATCLFFWAFFVRKKPKHARGALVLERPTRDSRESHNSSGRRKHRKRRPDHPDNWGRNPTLSETGGLPPIRLEDADDPPSPESQTPPAR